MQKRPLRSGALSHPGAIHEKLIYWTLADHQASIHNGVKQHISMLAGRQQWNINLEARRSGHN